MTTILRRAYHLKHQFSFNLCLCHFRNATFSISMRVEVTQNTCMYPNLNSRKGKFWWSCHLFSLAAFLWSNWHKFERINMVPKCEIKLTWYEMLFMTMMNIHILIRSFIHVHLYAPNLINAIIVFGSTDLSWSYAFTICLLSTHIIGTVVVIC